MNSIYSSLDRMTKKAGLAGSLSGGVKCLACARGCVVPDGGRGRCLVRSNKGGNLFAPRGYVSSLGFDPVEKKPFFHFLPGRRTLSFGMLGCNFRCPFCQNYPISQALKDESGYTGVHEISAEKMAEQAVRGGAGIVVSTYNEPFITCEWSKEIFEKAKEKGLKTAFVSNGFAGEKSLDFISPVLDAINVDLKCFSGENYRKVIGGELAPVLNCIRRAHKSGLWLEVVTLLIPGFNDSPDEMSEMAAFIKSVSPSIPWHVTAFHPDYRMLDANFTPAATLNAAREIGFKTGLRHVYAGNMRIPGAEDTFCPDCGKVLIKRSGFALATGEIRVSEGGKGFCPECRTQIAGIWK